MIRQLMRGYCKKKKLKKVQVEKSMPAVICKKAFPVTTRNCNMWRLGDCVMKQQRAKGQRQGEGHWTALTYI